MTRLTRFSLLFAAIASLGGCGFHPRSDGNAPTIGVMLRGGAGQTAHAASACNVTEGAAEMSINLYDPDGLKSALVTYSGAIAPAGVQMNPGGDDIVLTEGGLPGDRKVSVTFSPLVAGQVRTSAVLAFETAAPHEGTLSVTATDQNGTTTRAGPFRLAKPGGC